MALQAARSCRLSPRRGVPPPNLQAVNLNAAAAEPPLNQVLVVFVQSNQMRQLCPVGSRLRRAAVAWPQLSSGRKRSVQTSTVAMARVWRPDMNDVDRLSKGDGAKKRGTGNFNIPHRLNLDERPVYEAAKKKGYLQVRGTGYRKGRKGNPLPNIYRQWCDAKAQACVVIEQDMVGSGTDCVVVDLSPLRVTNIQPAVQLCHDLAAAAGAHQVSLAERPLDAVPFNVIPVELPQPVQQMLYPDSTPAATAAAVTPEQISTAEEAVMQQADVVRQLKAGGQDNSSPEVQQQVQVLLQLKANLQQLLDSAAESGVTPDIREGASTRDSSHLMSNSGSSSISSSDSSHSSEDQCSGSSVSSNGSSSDVEGHGTSVVSGSNSRRREVLDEEHPYVNVAIWQLPVMPLFYEADRTTAKALAKSLSTALAQKALAQR